jgi:hypothetical protein
MSQQTIRQRARRTAGEMAYERRRKREERSGRLAEQVMVVIGQHAAASCAGRRSPVRPADHDRVDEGISA